MEWGQGESVVKQCLTGVTRPRLSGIHCSCGCLPRLSGFQHGVGDVMNQLWGWGCHESSTLSEEQLIADDCLKRKNPFYLVESVVQSYLVSGTSAMLQWMWTRIVQFRFSGLSKKIRDYKKLHKFG